MERKIFTIKSIEQEGSVKIFTLSPDDHADDKSFRRSFNEKLEKSPAIFQSSASPLKSAGLQGKKNIQFKPGQFAMLHQLEDNNFGKLSRPYSIASSPLENHLRFAIKITGGQFTSILDKMQIGEKLGVAAPFGHFFYNEEEKIICIAAGTGVAPMLGILEYIAQKKKQGKFTLFYSNKRQEWIGCKSILEKLQSENPDIKMIYALTQEQPPDWKGELGRISGEMISKYVDYAKDATVFICGPMEFAKTMKEIMLKLGADAKKIKVEAWG